MTKFEVGKRYGSDAHKYQVVNKSSKFVTLVYVHHAGRWNEHLDDEQIKLRIKYWDKGEAAFKKNGEAIYSWE